MDGKEGVGRSRKDLVVCVGGITISLANAGCRRGQDRHVGGGAGHTQEWRVWMTFFCVGLLDIAPPDPAHLLLLPPVKTPLCVFPVFPPPIMPLQHSLH